MNNLIIGNDPAFTKLFPKNIILEYIGFNKARSNVILSVDGVVNYEKILEVFISNAYSVRSGANIHYRHVRYFFQNKTIF